MLGLMEQRLNILGLKYNDMTHALKLMRLRLPIIGATVEQNAG